MDNFFLHIFYNISICWKAHYMGDDGSFTMYIDLVKEEFAKNSTSVDRYNLNDYKSIEEIFNKIKN